MRALALVAALALLGCTCIRAADRYYLGALGGLATLTGDASSSLSPGGAQASLYDPSNGPAVNVFAGTLLSDYLSLQLNYLQNSNRLVFFSSNAAAGNLAAYRESRDSSQHSFIADLLLYFRNRRSEFRPYLSVGGGLVHLASQRRTAASIGSPVTPAEFSDTRAALRVAVGIDVRIRRGWSFRYSFSETTSQNPLSERLSPPGSHLLMNFQNLFGFLKRF